MFHEEELRRELKRRRPRSGREIWPGLQHRLEAAPQRPRLRWAAGIAACVAAAAFIFLSRGGNRPDRGPAVRIAQVRAFGVPAHAIVLEPDPHTVMVIVEGRTKEEENP
jgi:hypothetical protein